MLFEGNVAGERGSHKVGEAEVGDVPPGYEDVGNSRFQTACVGIAVARDEDGDDWEMLPPLLTAVGVNDQTERPHFVFQDGKYYLFTISHTFTYADGVTGPDGVYGFVADSLFGPYVPLNGSGLVLGNPSSQPFQTYSHCVMPNGLVTSFIDSVPTDETGTQIRIGGTEDTDGGDQDQRAADVRGCRVRLRLHPADARRHAQVIATQGFEAAGLSSMKNSLRIGSRYPT